MKAKELERVTVLDRHRLYSCSTCTNCLDLPIADDIKVFSICHMAKLFEAFVQIGGVKPRKQNSCDVKSGLGLTIQNNWLWSSILLRQLYTFKVVRKSGISVAYQASKNPKGCGPVVLKMHQAFESTAGWDCGKGWGLNLGAWVVQIISELHVTD